VPLVLLVVEDPRLQAQQVLEAGVRILRQDAGQPILDRVGQRELALGNELQHHGCDDRLGHARHAEPMVRRERFMRLPVRHAPSDEQGLLAIDDSDRHTRDSGSHEPIGACLEVGNDGAVERGFERGFVIISGLAAGPERARREQSDE
jgi:hypothetical protein